jgi:hypothetical protein
VLGKQLKRIAERPVVEDVSPHRFRGTFAITYLRNEGDIFTLGVPSLPVNFARSSDVDTVIVDGRILMRKKEILFVDEEALIKEFNADRKDLLKRVGVIGS